MTINFNIDYYTLWGESLYICGSIPQLGAWNEEKALALSCRNSSGWSAPLEIEDGQAFDYYYFIKKDDSVVRREWGAPRSVSPDKVAVLDLLDAWHEQPQQEFLYTSAFSDSFFAHKPAQNKKRFNQSILLNVVCPYIEKNQELILCGATEILGNWEAGRALHLNFLGNSSWQLSIDATTFYTPLEYKLAIADKKSKEVVYWENGDNRLLNPLSDRLNEKITRNIELVFRHNPLYWKAAGVAIPVFSLRSEAGFGIGEFSDLMKMVDWAAKTGQKIIQVLPVNDTTISHTWMDSYPYNAISIYALHPLYLGLKDFPLKNKKLLGNYLRKAQKLNALACLDYEAVAGLKRAYFNDLFDEAGQETLSTAGFSAFYALNNDWLFPYACFSFLRDKFGTAAYSEWKDFAGYDKDKLETLIKTDASAKRAVEMSYFIQYLLHIQLSGLKNYAHSKGVILKGDIPIGISRNSVEAWVEPHLFRLDSQTGAPPDDFSVTGQNWGFPTYNWDEMAKDGYRWWIRRFRKMGDYFDAYRIDHILGFFRIWEIPLHSVQGLLGCFSPALPFTLDEMESTGFVFDEQRMIVPHIHANNIPQLFGEYTQEVIDIYLTAIDSSQFRLKDFCDTQLKIKSLFDGKDDEKSNIIREGLYSLCNEVLFIRDKKEPDKFHPRISAQNSFSFLQLDEPSKIAFNRLYEHFFYYRHNQFWKEQAMQKLPVLISSTRMLVCGEDLGMIPQSVPEVMDELQILSLEIQRMPKRFGLLFEDLSTIPYLSVCTASTHDMSTIRGWWKENPAQTQRYYNEVLQLRGTAPEDCNAELCREIVSLHLKSAAMLVILPLQDWLSMDAGLRRKKAEDERINIPAIPRHYWKYRMHLTLEQLLGAKDLNNSIASILASSERNI
ncbi:4-alpha-glucanotransferase [Viscerimonas tarda]